MDTSKLDELLQEMAVEDDVRKKITDRLSKMGIPEVTTMLQEIYIQSDVQERIKDKMSSMDPVCQELQEKGVSREMIQKINDVSVEVFKLMKFSDLIKRCELSWRECRDLQEKFYVDKGIWKKKAIDYKIFNDPIHGNMKIHLACVAIIDTPQFQRLRNLKQLGGCYFVYPGASHNRFEHSLGACYLAGQVARSLRDNQPYLGITDIDILCVEIAGLCHDLGHGPLSHLFDRKVVPELKKNEEKKKKKEEEKKKIEEEKKKKEEEKKEKEEPSKQEGKWEHEQMSVKLIDFLLEQHGLWSENPTKRKLAEWGLEQKDINFIKQLIDPQKTLFMTTEQEVEKSKDSWGKLEKETGRGLEKAFLYEIVANKRNGIDVDKWDYLARDSYQLNITSNFDHKRYMSFLRVAEEHGQTQLCARDKEIVGLYNMYGTRFALHKAAYQHQVVKGMERMIYEAMVACGDAKLIPGAEGEKRTILECLNDEEAYTNLTDTIFDVILFSDDKNLEVAKNILKRVFRHDFYKCVKESGPLDPQKLGTKKTEDIEEEMLDSYRKSEKEHLEKEDFCVEIVSLDFGDKEQNPLKNLCCFARDNPDHPRPLTDEEVSRILVPKFFQEQVVRVYSRNNKKNELVGKAYEEWKKTHLLPVKLGLDELQSDDQSMGQSEHSTWS